MTDTAPSADAPDGGDTLTSGRTWLAALAIGGLVAGLAVGGVVIARNQGGQAVSAGGPGGTVPVLHLLNGSGKEGATAAALAPDRAMYPYPGAITYRLEGTLPDLGSTAPVYRTVAPAMDAGRVAGMAKAVGITGPPTKDAGGWVVAGADRGLRVFDSGSAWSISYGLGVEGGGGSGSSGGASGSASGVAVASPGSPGSAGADNPVAVEPTGPATPAGPATTVVPPPMPSLPPITSPAHLPDAGGAEAAARSVLDAMGVLDGTFRATVSDGQAMGTAIACSSDAPCPSTPPTTVVLSRLVQFTRVVDNVPVEHLGWSVEVGDNARIERVDGMLATLEKVGAYPLRSTRAVFDDLAAGKAFPIGPVPMMAETAVAKAGVAQTDAGSSPGAIAPGEPVPGKPAPDAPMPDQPAPPPSTGAEPPVSMAPTVVVVTGASRSAALLPGTEAGRSVLYVVPAYRFVGRIEQGRSPWQTDLLALDPSTVVGDATPPSSEPPATGIEPSPAPMPAPAPMPMPEPMPSPAPGTTGRPPSSLPVVTVTEIPQPPGTPAPR